MRRVAIGLVVLLAAMLLGGRAEAQSCDGCGIKYTPPSSTLTTAGASFFAGGISLGNTVASPYANLYGDAANTLALRNSTNAQVFNIYETYTDASNYVRLLVGETQAGYLGLRTQGAGTGSSTPPLLFGVGASNVFLMQSSLNTSYANLAGASDDATNLGTIAVRWQTLYLTRSTQGSKTKALTEGAATTVATVAVPQTAGSNFAAGEVRYTVYASDGTDSQALNGSAFFSAVNKAGTEACQLTDDQIGTEAASAGTLVCTVACATGLTDVVGITFDCTSSLTQTTLNALVRFDMQQPNTLTFP